jgi:hypothetical protein
MLIRLSSRAVNLSANHPDARRLKLWIPLGDDMHTTDWLNKLRVDEVDSNGTGLVHHIAICIAPTSQFTIPLRVFP